MLESLHVKNLALIEETEVVFGKSLNILTGETGAGKSIIIGSINLALGAKADKDMIRHGAEYALIELVFCVQSKVQIEAIKALDLPVEEDGTVLISRKITENRSVCKVNGETVIAKQLKALAEILIDIHGQHEHQTLLNVIKQRDLLDSYAGEEVSKAKQTLGTKYREYLSKKEELEEAFQDIKEKNRELDLARFEVQEIETAHLKEGEDESLENEYNKVLNFQKIGQAIGTIEQICSYDSDQSVGTLIARALRELGNVADLDPELQDMNSMLSDIDGLVGDFTRQISHYLSNMEFDEAAFYEMESRLNAINHLKDKYGATIEQILEYSEKQQQLIEKYENFDAYKEQLQKDCDRLYHECLELCKQISNLRKAEASQLSKQMLIALKDLNFLDVAFEIQVEASENQMSATGFDSVCFMISTNPGERLKPLHQIASGGELSRVMLALKTVLADRDQIETMIFDEIDSGISGKTAWKVAEKIGVLGREHQVICITHLPQIAARANTHFMIEKRVQDQKTTTHIKELKEEDSIEELSRLLGGDMITDAVRDNARELKKMAMVDSKTLKKDSNE